MQARLILVFATLFCMWSPAEAVSQARAQKDELVIPIDQQDISTIQSCLEKPEQNCRKCNSQGSSNLSLMNFVLVREALNASGYNARLTPVPSPNSERSRQMINDGIADIKIDWSFNITGQSLALKSEPIINQGEIEKGLYTSPDVAKSYKYIELADIRRLHAIGIRSWRLDWQVLEFLSPASLTNVATSKQLYRLINAKRADFTLLEFSSSQDFRREQDGIGLLPISGIKVILPASKHFMVSNTNKDAENLIAKLNLGIEILRQTGFIRRCLIDSGVVNPKVAGWRVLNPEMADPKPNSTEAASH